MGADESLRPSNTNLNQETWKAAKNNQLAMKSMSSKAEDVSANVKNNQEMQVVKKNGIAAKAANVPRL
ncbi:MAG: hypothetical protein O7A65_03580 [Proteobacteria bacterium]|nr:hypothetical protein [Pseudomonadota bacterium]